MAFSVCKALAMLFIPFASFFSALRLPEQESFIQCLHHNSSFESTSQILYFPNTTSYTSLLLSTINNGRFLSSPTHNPLLIIAPTSESQIQASVLCCKQHNIEVRVRSGGHDFEGLSYQSPNPFVIIDLAKFNSIDINIAGTTAWVQSGATLGELYYRIAEKSNTLGFPAGYCHTVGVGGHFNGGGVGAMVRKYGLAADNILDAYLVDANGKLLDRKSMGEDLFWAIRGGGGSSFGIIISWKIKLVHVPPIVTIFSIGRTQEQGAAKLVNKWQHIADKLDDNIFLTVNLTAATGNTRTIQASFRGYFLGSVKELQLLMDKSFPELGMQPKDCTEMSWIDMDLYAAGFTNGTAKEALLSKDSPHKAPFKIKYDYVNEPIPELVFEGAWKLLMEGPGIATLILDPMGGRMNEILETEIPFPHREGNLYNIQYLTIWQNDSESEKHLEWIKRMYEYMGPYVSKSPRGAYLNCKDLDLGKNEKGSTTFSNAKTWGLKYFKSNFRRLARVKSVVDADNFFWNEQSIPPLDSIFVSSQFRQESANLQMQSLFWLHRTNYSKAIHVHLNSYAWD